MTNGFARSPLEHRLEDLASFAARTGGRVRASHVPFLAQVDLRLDPSLLDRAPYPLPERPNAAWEAGERAALRLGPDRWLVLGPPMRGGEIVSELEAALAGVHRSVVDVSAANAAIEFSGPGAKDLLATGCSIDLHPRAWRAGMCTRTLLARVPVILHERAGSTGVLVGASFAGHLLDRLLAAIDI